MHRWNRLFPFFAFILGACGGQSCSCLQPLPGGFPTDGRRHEDALQVRVTQGGLDYLGQNGTALVDTLLPGGTTFNIPPSCAGSNTVCCGNPQPTCTLDINVESFQLGSSPPSSLTFDLRTQLISKTPIPVGISIGIGTTHCLVTIDTTKGTNGHTDIGITSNVDFTVDGTTKLTDIALTNTDIVDLDPSMIDLAAVNQLTDFACTLVDDVSVIKTFVIQQLQSQLTSQISGAVDNALCSKCSVQGDCDSFADACTGGKCMRMGKCLQEVGAAGRINVGALFASLSPTTKAQMDTIAVLGSYANVTPMPTGGLSLGMIGGGQGDPHNPCVPMRPAPDAPTVPRWAEEMGELEPLNMQPYHVAIGIHQTHLNTLGWAAFDAGALCLDVNTAAEPLLNSQTLGVLIPSLQDLLHGGAAPVALVMRPQVEPTLTIGNGTFNVDMNGNKTIKDPLLDVTMPSFAIDFYAFVDDRYVRILTLTADVAIPLGLDADGKGELVPILGDLTKAFSNLQVTNSELLAETPAQLAKAFPMLLGLAIGQIGSALKPIALPSVMGLNLSVVAIEPTDNKEFVAIFANIAVGMPNPFYAGTTATLQHVLVPPTDAFRVDTGMDPLVTPQVILAVSGTGRDGGDGDLEWSWSLDGSNLWSPYSTSHLLTVRDPRLWLQGRHRVAVRARVIGVAATTDPAPVVIDFLVDTIAPAGTFAVAGNEVSFSASDLVSPPSALSYRYNAGAGFSTWSASDRVTIPGGVNSLSLIVEARDEAGNVGQLTLDGAPTTSPTSSGWGCAMDGAASSTSGALAFVVVALGGLIVALRRRRRAPLALALLVGICGAGVGASGCHHSTATMMPPVLTKGDLLDPADEIGRFSDSVAVAGVIHVSAYDESLGDLAYAEIPVADIAQPITWQWVDGVPTTAPVSTPGGYRMGITEAGDDIGLYTSLAVTATGDPRIAYFDATHQQLKFAFATERVFTTSVVDLPATGTAGRYSSISLDAAGIPSIAYFVGGIPDGANGFVSRLRLATATTATPMATTDWNIVDLDETAISCAGLCAMGQACVPVDPTNKASKSTCTAVDAKPCPMACGAGQACIAAACVAYLAPVAAPGLPEGTGLFPTLLHLTSGRAVVYYDHQVATLRLQLEGAPGAFAGSVIDGNLPMVDVGQFATAMVAPDNSIRVAYVDAIANQLLYKSITGGAAQMSAEVIDNGMRSDGPHPVGAGASLWTDGTSVRVVYQDQETSDLWQSTRSGTSWSMPAALLSGPAGYGFYPHLVSDGSQLYLTEFVYDRASQAAGSNLGALAVQVVP